MKTLFAFSFVFLAPFAQSAFAAPVVQGTYMGADKTGARCYVQIDSIKIGAVKHRDACDFETDGRGPWCEGKPAVAVTPMSGTGAIFVGGKEIAITVPQQEATLDGDVGNGIGFYAEISSGADKGATIGISSVAGHGPTLEFQVDIKTAKARAMTGDQINKALFDGRGPNYESVYHTLYTTYDCVGELQ